MGLTRDELRDRCRAVYLQAMLYAASPDRFRPDPEERTAAESVGARPIALPLEGWRFKLDPNHVGRQQEWFSRDMDASDWDEIRIGTNWESQGYEYDGYAWYRREFEARNRKGQRTLLYFGAVDEQAVVYVDGKLAGTHKEGPQGYQGWNKPFSIDITRYLTDQREKHLLAVEVHDHAAAGGIWRPVFIQHVPE
jgi:beta-galactosidase/beta-glucuronidase